MKFLEKLFFNFCVNRVKNMKSYNDKKLSILTSMFVKEISARGYVHSEDYTMININIYPESMTCVDGVSYAKVQSSYPEVLATILEEVKLDSDYFKNK